jgi:cystathionine beta-lyase/cystathionine gamma-synthase
MTQKDPYTLSLDGGDIDRVSQPTYEALQKAITNLVTESGARGFKIESGGSARDATIRKLFVHDVVAP